MTTETQLPYDPNAKVAGEPLGAADKIFDNAQQYAFSFKPISQIKQALCALHPYAHDPSRVVPAYHYCTHNNSSDLHQCLIFDSNEPEARLIGVEYIIPEKLFVTLDEDEKRYWHSHKTEIESGLLAMIAKVGIPSGVDDALELPAMMSLHTTYGKTFHFWQIDRGDKLPLGPPTLMKSFNDISEVTPELVRDQERRTGTSVERKRQFRAKHLDLSYQVAHGADRKGPGMELVLKEDA